MTHFGPLGSDRNFIDSFTSLLRHSTMVDPRSHSIHDFFIAPAYLNKKSAAGIVAPDPEQENLLNFGQVACVKSIFLVRTRISTYTDHWPVWCRFSTDELKDITMNEFLTQKKVSTNEVKQRGRGKKK